MQFLEFLKSLCQHSKKEDPKPPTLEKSISVEIEAGTEVEVQTEKTIDYLLNDPSTPDLKKLVPVPEQSPHLPIKVVGWEGGIPDNHQKLQAANCYITLVNCISYVQNWMKWNKKELQRWAAVPQLKVVPRAGEDLNAYYDRKHLKFFFALNPTTMKPFYTVDSGDIVAHELGHAILDALRPDFWNVQALEIWSFHESFGDVTAIANIMRHPEILERAITETGGDLLKSNIISKLAEEFGQVLYALVEGQHGYKSHSLRDASTVFKYKNPKSLPTDGRNDELIAECHSFGRTFVSAWYRIVVGIYQIEMKAGKKPVEALTIASNSAYKLLIGAVIKSPRVNKYYEVVSKLMIRMAQTHHPEYVSMIEKIFKEWGFIVPQIKMLARNVPSPVSKSQIDEETMTACVSGDQTIKLADHIPRGYISAMSVGRIDLAHLNIEVPSGAYYEFDLDGNLVDMVKTEIDTVVDDARLCALSISDSMNLGEDHRTMWEVDENKLIRTRIECCAR
jgi:hypothetical protein